MCNVDLEIHLVPYSSNLLYELLPSGQPKNDKHLFDSEEKKVDLEFSRTRRQWVGSHNQSYLERMVNAPWEWMNPKIISEFVWLHSASPQEYNDFNHLRGSVCFQRLKTCDPIDDPKAAQCCQLREEESSRQGLFFHCVIPNPTLAFKNHLQ